MNQNLRWFSGCSARYSSTKTHTVNPAVHITRPEARQIHSSSVVGENAFHPSPACIPPILSVSANAFRTWFLIYSTPDKPYPLLLFDQRILAFSYFVFNSSIAYTFANVCNCGSPRFIPSSVPLRSPNFFHPSLNCRSFGCAGLDVLHRDPSRYSPGRNQTIPSFWYPPYTRRNLLYLLSSCQCEVGALACPSGLSELDYGKIHRVDNGVVDGFFDDDGNWVREDP